MSEGPIPARTYVVAAALSVLVNLGAVGTFATMPMDAAGARQGIDAGPTVVLSSLSTPEPPAATPALPPPKVDAPPPPPASPPPPAPIPEPRDEPQEREVKLGNPDAPESASKVWLGVSKDAGEASGHPGSVD